MRNPSSLPGDVQGAQMNEREKYYLEEQKKECAIPENNRGMCFPNGVLMQNCYEKWLKAGKKDRLHKTDVIRFNFILVLQGTESELL